jgi:predicted MarR family transcription regulator
MKQEPNSLESIEAAGLVAPIQDFEASLITAGQAFQRWALRCMAASGLPDLAFTDILVLHHVNHRARDKKLADIVFILNIEDAYVISYSLRKLQSLGLVRATRQGKEVLYSASEQGAALCRRYYEIREHLLVQGLDSTGIQDVSLETLARFLRVLSGQYDQSGRSAATI